MKIDEQMKNIDDLVMTHFLSNLNLLLSPTHSVILTTNKIPRLEEAFVWIQQAAFESDYNTATSPSKSHITLGVARSGVWC